MTLPTPSEGMPPAAVPGAITRADLANRFTYHPPRDGQAEEYEEIRAAGHDLAKLITDLCPNPSRELATAVTKIEEAVMWANAAIARHG